MSVLIILGSNPNNAADDLVPFTVRNGDTIVVANDVNSPVTLNCHGKGHNGGVTATAAPNTNQTFTDIGGHYLSAPGRAFVKISGGIYGP